MEIQNIFQIMIAEHASDAFLNVGSAIHLKVEGITRPVNSEIIPNGTIERFIYTLMSPKQIEQFETNWELDLLYETPELNRFRINVFKQSREIGLVIRYIMHVIPTIETLKLPQILKTLIMQRSGLILLVGPTGSGKSTTLASMLEYRNMNSTSHILTIENPIEYILRPKQSVITQREIGTDTHSYQNALNHALRESPDVIMVGEILDLQSMQQVLGCSQSGHLCLATLHANNCVQAVQRISAFFSPVQREQVFSDISTALQGIISQRLILGVDGKRIVATEVMLRAPDICENIQRGTLYDLNKLMDCHKEQGMMTFNQSLIDLVNKGLITKEEALRNTDSQNDLKLGLRLGSGDTDALNIPITGVNQGTFFEKKINLKI